ncbi:MAG: hypothetical protein ACI9HK_002547 [Pirellulaceae bacterium]|jgi:hypothetical protein
MGRIGLARYARKTIDKPAGGQRLLGIPNAVKHENALEPACSTTSTRLMRTRMSGDVGASRGDGASYPILLRLFYLQMPRLRFLL